MAKFLSKSLAATWLFIVFIQIFCLFLSAPIRAEAEEIKFTPQITVGEFQEQKPIAVSNNTAMIAKYIKAIYNYGIGIVGIVAVIVMMAGGLLWLTAGGNPDQTGKAKTMIGAGLLGLLLALLSFAILRTVNPALVNLQTSQIASIPAANSNSQATAAAADGSLKFMPQISMGRDFIEKTAYSLTNDTGMIAKYIRAIYNYAIGIVGIVAVIAMMIGGFLWITAGGSAPQIGNAKAWIGASLSGLLLVILSYSILRLINPGLVDLRTSPVASIKEPAANTAQVSSPANTLQFTPQISIGAEFKEKTAYSLTNDTGMIAKYIRAIYKYAIAIVGIIAVIAMMVGGFLWITAAGGAPQVGNAKAWIGASLSGLLLVIFSYAILKTVNPALVNLKPTAIPTIKEMGGSCKTDADCGSGLRCNTLYQCANDILPKDVPAGMTVKWKCLPLSVPCEEGTLPPTVSFDRSACGELAPSCPVNYQSFCCGLK